MHPAISSNINIQYNMNMQSKKVKQTQTHKQTNSNNKHNLHNSSPPFWLSSNSKQGVKMLGWDQLDLNQNNEQDLNAWLTSKM